MGLIPGSPRGAGIPASLLGKRSPQSPEGLAEGTHSPGILVLWEVLSHRKHGFCLRMERGKKAGVGPGEQGPGSAQANESSPETEPDHRPSLPPQAHPSSLLLLPAMSPPIPADAPACRQQREGWGRLAQAQPGDLALGSSAVGGGELKGLPFA